MSFLELCNWYENRFPNDFEQLIKIKHYNISDLSFLLSKVWCKLDYAEQLLMCAVYYDDFNLASQMLNENSLHRVNPFFGKRFFTQTPSKTYLSSTGSIGSSVFDLDEIIDVNNHGGGGGVFDSLPASTPVLSPLVTMKSRENANNQRRNSYFKESRPQAHQQRCMCQNYARRTSLSSIRQIRSSLLVEAAQLSNEIHFVNPYAHMNAQIGTNRRRGSGSAAGSTSSNVPTYYFDQVVCDFYMHTPFYFAIKYNKVKMCELFIEHLKTIYISFVSKKMTRKQQLQSSLLNPTYCHNCQARVMHKNQASLLN